MDKYKDFSNAELRIKMETIKNEYEATRAQTKACIDKLESLNQEYNNVKAEFDRRINSMF